MALAAVAAIAAGYGVAALFDWTDPPEPSQHSAIQSSPQPANQKAWYKTQSPPPALVSDPAAPILPDPNGEPVSSRPRAYEEALPEGVYHTPPVSSVPPVPRVPPVQTEAPSVPLTPPPVPLSPTAPQATTTPPAPTQKPTQKPIPQPNLTAGQPTWEQFALATPEPNGRPMIAIVIDDLGMDRIRTAKMVNLPGPLTLSFLAYADDLALQTREIRASGHELMLHVSMEPGSKTIDPGPNVLLATDTPDEIRRRLIWGLERLSGFVGINNHMGSRFTEDRAAMSVVMSELKARGLLFLDSRTTSRSVGADLGREVGVPVVERNVFLDNVNEVTAVNARLAEVERVAKRAGAAVAIGHPRDATLTALAEWLPKLQAKGFVLVPLTAIVRSAMSRDRDGAG